MDGSNPSFETCHDRQGRRPFEVTPKKAKREEGEVMMPIARLCFLAALVAALAPADLRATLVVVIPTGKGLLFAADSRSVLKRPGSEQRVPCDGRQKLFVSKRSPLLVGAVAGELDEVVTFDGPVTPDVCKELPTLPRLLDLTGVMVRFLDENRDPFSKASIGEFARQLENEFSRYISEPRSMNRTFFHWARYRPVQVWEIQP